MNISSMLSLGKKSLQSAYGSFLGQILLIGFLPLISESRESGALGLYGKSLSISIIIGSLCTLKSELTLYHAKKEDQKIFFYFCLTTSLALNFAAYLLMKAFSLEESYSLSLSLGYSIFSLCIISCTLEENYFLAGTIKAIPSMLFVTISLLIIDTAPLDKIHGASFLLASLFYFFLSRKKFSLVDKKNIKTSFFHWKKELAPVSGKSLPAYTLSLLGMHSFPILIGHFYPGPTSSTIYYIYRAMQLPLSFTAQSLNLIFRNDFIKNRSWKTFRKFFTASILVSFSTLIFSSIFFLFLSKYSSAKIHNEHSFELWPFITLPFCTLLIYSTLSQIFILKRKYGKDLAIQFLLFSATVVSLTTFSNSIDLSLKMLCATQIVILGTGIFLCFKEVPHNDS